MEKLKKDLKREEGLKLHAFMSPLGSWTCGYGHNLEAAGCSKETIERYKIEGITKAQAEKWLDEDIRKAEQAARNHVSFFDELSERRQEVLVTLVFMFGWQLRQSKRIINALERRNYEDAAKQILKSKMAARAGERVRRLAEMMREEEQPEELAGDG
ncbi:glycoside hydrolase family protein [Desulforhabdus amnigena]|uniref:glycoside hydrolase family protein n=1 Tax=Desulforhabdus amnigena TaxID=40218 RepID=UPI00168E7593|nr:glycoside hydrolase family protein [Desulforhabdus amnigena]NLJ27884.1 glycoside hydrolase family protein [Deltaproteobacteria bacterium]